MSVTQNEMRGNVKSWIAEIHSNQSQLREEDKHFLDHLSSLLAEDSDREVLLFEHSRVRELRYGNAEPKKVEGAS